MVEKEEERLDTLRRLQKQIPDETDFTKRRAMIAERDRLIDELGEISSTKRLKPKGHWRPRRA